MAIKRLVELWTRALMARNFNGYWSEREGDPSGSSRQEEAHASLEALRAGSTLQVGSGPAAGGARCRLLPTQSQTHRVDAHGRSAPNPSLTTPAPPLHPHPSPTYTQHEKLVLTPPHTQKWKKQSNNY